MHSSARHGRRARLRPSLVVPTTLALGVLALSSCGRGGAAAASGDGSPSATAGASASALLRTQPANPDPCALVARAEVERWLGRLSSDPVRVEGARRSDPAADGRACVYQLEDGPAGAPRAVAVEVVTYDATATVQDGDGGDSAARDPVRGWDYLSVVPGRTLTARQGDVAVEVNVQAPALPPDAVTALAARFIEAMPDVPIAAPPLLKEVDGAGDEARYAADGGRVARDPCALVTRAEAEAVLGPLTAPPYRSRASTALADPRGSSCAYHTRGHRVLVLSPTWTMGRATYATLRASSQGLGRLFGGERAADTLHDRRWDRAAAALDGRLLFLAGDRMLEVKYRASSTDASGALELARAALRRL